MQVVTRAFFMRQQIYRRYQMKDYNFSNITISIQTIGPGNARTRKLTDVLLSFPFFK
ncbi:hypothetical protein N018_06810 [Pseudomonas syringae CC1557]|uniref:Uncharacterized protein n=1 Tax=Pseudomonas syringae CC1557 TaxID=1357279 RepID=W0N227_PSESX|nr:hypothetical protein N018_06810 [Pseudomonas syringae CC1557]